MKFTIFTMAFALLAALPLNAHAADKTAEQANPVITAVAFHSDNCGACKILGPRMKEAKQIINQEKFSVVKFNFTDKETIEATKALAVEKNVDNLLQQYGAKTGFVVLLNSAGQEVDKISVEDDIAAIAAKLATAIANAS